MPEVMDNLSIQQIAKLIQAMNRQELETLYLLLTEEGKELFNRKQDVEERRIHLLSREEVFNVS
ncbi:hypothetical protein U27_04959 [Candidatus Vecturithrix granuli]|uniref:Uncharacterized protein n=1 Tax=Vecturithrix granuli TaxID=1499967 RepID=A0A081C081_VECG1|nr:hypothetical protein U27_04959 [Candidatus Vecturithrix granuli]